MQGNPIPTPEQIGAQPVDADLTAIAALTTTGLIDRTGSGTAVTRTTGETGLDLLAAATTAAARTTLGVGELTNGTWTPAYSMSTSGSVTPSLATGTWVRIANIVWFDAVLQSSGVVSPSGNVRLTIPFAAKAGTNAPIIKSQVLNWATDMPNLQLLIATTVFNGVILRKHATNASVSNVVAADLSTASGGNYILYGGFYEVA